MTVNDLIRHLKQISIKDADIVVVDKFGEKRKIDRVIPDWTNGQVELCVDAAFD